jgi:subtilisin family serine protease
MTTDSISNNTPDQQPYSPTLQDRAKRLIRPLTGLIATVAIAASMIPEATSAQPLQQPIDPLTAPVGLIVTVKPGTIMPMSASSSPVNPNVYSITTSDLAAAEQQLQGNPDVLSFEPMYQRKAYGEVLSGALDNEWYVTRVGAQTARAAGFTGEDSSVAVIDTGVSQHSELVDNLGNGYDFVDNDNLPNDCNGHGTHVAGIVQAIGNGTTIHTARVLDCGGYGNDLDISNAIDWAVAEKVNAINLSLGGPMYNAMLCDRVKKANDAGIAVVVAAGNASSDAPDYPRDCDSRNISVAATGNMDMPTTYTNYGPIDIAAPGGDGPDNSPGLIRSTWLNNGYYLGGGTSMAAPMVAGGIAILLDANPSLTNHQAAQRLIDNSLDLGQIGPDPYYGAGRLDIAAALGLATPPRITNIEVSSLSFPHVGGTVILTATIRDAWSTASQLKVEGGFSDPLQTIFYQPMHNIGGELWTGKIYVSSNYQDDPITRQTILRAFSNSTGLSAALGGPFVTIRDFSADPDAGPKGSIELGPDISTCPIDGVVQLPVDFTIVSGDRARIRVTLDGQKKYENNFTKDGDIMVPLIVENGKTYKIGGYAAIYDDEIVVPYTAQDASNLTVKTEAECKLTEPDPEDKKLYLPLIIR